MKSKYEVSKVKKERSSRRRDSVVVLCIVVKRMDFRERLIRVQFLVVSLTSCVTWLGYLTDLCLIFSICLLGGVGIVTDHLGL